MTIIKLDALAEADVEMQEVEQRMEQLPRKNCNRIYTSNGKVIRFVASM